MLTHACVCLNVIKLERRPRRDSSCARIPPVSRPPHLPPTHTHTLQPCGGKNKPQQTAPSACLEVATAPLGTSHLAITFSVAVLIARLSSLGERKTATLTKRSKRAKCSSFLSVSTFPSVPPRPPLPSTGLFEMFSQRTQDTRFSLGRGSLSGVATKLLTPQPRRKNKRRWPFFFLFLSGKCYTLL